MCNAHSEFLNENWFNFFHFSAQTKNIKKLIEIALRLQTVFFSLQQEAKAR